MERMGPRGGDVFEMNLLVAGRDHGEVDYVGISIMGYSVDEVKHLKYHLEKNRLDTRLIQVVGEKLEDVKRPFQKVRMEYCIPKGITGKVDSNNMTGDRKVAFGNRCSGRMKGDIRVKGCPLYPYDLKNSL
jgi:uncharacterized protein (DUF362 family)